jgi:thiamine biosynthesis lipoprotein
MEKEFKALGTDIYFQLVCDESLKEKARQNLMAAQAFYFLAEKIFSRFDGNSELSRLNQNLGKFLKVSPHFLAVARKIIDWHNLSEGIFDPRVIGVLEKFGYVKDFKQIEFFFDAIPKNDVFGIMTNDLADDLIIRDGEILFNQRMDFAGIAKGYITDMAGEMLRSAGFENFLLDSGGDMLAKGVDSRGEDWKIDIEGIAVEKILLVLRNEAVATSGIGKRKWQSGEKRFHHLIDPKNPENFSFDLQSVTIIAKTAEEADFWAKVLFLKGKVDGKKLALENKLKAIFLDYRSNVWVSSEMKNNIQ